MASNSSIEMTRIAIVKSLVDGSRFAAAFAVAVLLMTCGCESKTDAPAETSPASAPAAAPATGAQPASSPIPNNIGKGDH
jgi:hypothetical protein